MASNPWVLEPEEQVLPIGETPSHPYYYNSQLGDELPKSYLDSMKAALGLTIDSLPTTKLGDYLVRRQIEKDNSNLPMLSPQEANTRYPEVDRPFTDPVNPVVAEEIARNARDRREMESISSRGPGGVLGFTRTGASFVLGMMDPLSLAAGELTLGLTGLKAGLGAKATAGQVFRREATSGFVGGLAAEAVNAPLTIDNQQDYDALDALRNVTAFSLGFAGLHAGIRYGVPKVASFFDRTPEVSEAAHKVSVAQAATDRSIDVEALTRDRVRELDGTGRTKDGQIAPGYEYRPMDLNQVHAHDLYFATRENGVQLSDAPKSPLEEDFGSGIYLTDNPLVANGVAGSKYNGPDGKIFHTKVNSADLKFIDLETKFDGQPKELVGPLLKEAWGAKRAEAMLDTLSGKEVLANLKTAMGQGKIRPDSIESLNASLAENGFAGYRSEGGSFLGEKNAPHNIVMLFDPKNTGTAEGRLIPQGEYAPDRSLVGGVSYEELQSLAKERAGIQGDIRFDPTEHDTFEQMLSKPDQPLDRNVLDEGHTLATEELKSLQEQGLLDEHTLKEVEKLKEMEAQAAAEEKILKAAMSCEARTL